MRLKDYNVADRTFVLRIFVSFLAPFSILGAVMYFLLHLPWYLAPVASFFATCFVLLFFRFLFKVMDYATGHISTTSLRDRLSAEIDRIKYLKQNTKYDEALRIVESVLEKEPDFPEVLYLKGQILWEGFGLEFEAKEVLLKVMMSVSREDPIYHWALNYRKRILR
jgi:hypothetical protein